jgi:hypothetical protein
MLYGVSFMDRLTEMEAFATVVDQGGNLPSQSTSLLWKAGLARGF